MSQTPPLPAAGGGGAAGEPGREASEVDAEPERDGALQQLLASHSAEELGSLFLELQHYAGGLEKQAQEQEQERVRRAQELKDQQHVLRQTVTAQEDTERAYRTREARHLQRVAQLEEGQQLWFENMTQMRATLDRLQTTKSAQQSPSKGFFRSKRKPTAKEGGEAQADLDATMQQAQEDVDILKTVVLPMEHEIVELKRRIRELGGEVAGDSPSKKSLSASPLKAASPNPDQQLHAALQRAKSDQGDMKMQIQVLETQKAVLQGELEACKSQLEGEKAAHADLKLTWQRANEHFLDSQTALERRCKTLESLVDAQRKPAADDGQQEAGALEQPDGPEKLTAQVLQLQAALDSERGNSAQKMQQLDELTEQLRQSHERELRTRQEQWDSQKAQLSGEIKAQLMQLVAYEERLEAQRLLAEKRESEEASAGCDMCSNYEYKLVQMQHDVQDANERALSFEAQFRAKSLELDGQLEDHSKRHVKQMQELLDLQEYDLRQSFTSQLTAHDLEYTSLAKELELTVASLEERHTEAQAFFDNFQQHFEDAKQAKEGEVHRLRSALEDCGDDMATAVLRVDEHKAQIDELEDAVKVLEAANAKGHREAERLGALLGSAQQVSADKGAEAEEYAAQASALVATNETLNAQLKEAVRIKDGVVQRMGTVEARAVRLEEQVTKLQTAGDQADKNLALASEELTRLREVISSSATESRPSADAAAAGSVGGGGGGGEGSSSALAALQSKTRKVIRALQEKIHDDAEQIAELRAQLHGSREVEVELTAKCQQLQIKVSNFEDGANPAKSFKTTSLSVPPYGRDRSISH